MFAEDISNPMPKPFEPKSPENFAEKMKKFQIQVSKIHSDSDKCKPVSSLPAMP